MMRVHIHNSERTASLCGQQSEKLGREISDALIVVDATGWDPYNLLCRGTYQWAHQMAQMDAEHYPSRLKAMLVINSPSVVYHFWKNIKWILPEQKRRTVHILGGRDEWVPRLLELVDQGELPPEYGGTGVHRGL